MSFQLKGQTWPTRPPYLPCKAEQPHPSPLHLSYIMCGLRLRRTIGSLNWAYDSCCTGEGVIPTTYQLMGSRFVTSSRRKSSFQSVETASLSQHWWFGEAALTLEVKRKSMEKLTNCGAGNGPCTREAWKPHTRWEGTSCDWQVGCPW